jgi:uncharacterized protein
MPRLNAAQRKRVHSILVSATTSPLAVPVFDLMHRAGEMRELEIDAPVAEGFGNAVIGVKAGSEVHLDVRLEALHDGILVTAQADVTAEGECIRCLDPVSDDVQVDIAELFAYSEDEAFDYTVVDEHVDLEPLVRDAVVLALPFQPVCRPDCPGLDPETGEKLSAGSSREPAPRIDPRWSALEGFEADTTQD